MQRRRTTPWTLLCFALALTAGGAEPARITVDAGKPGAKVSPLLYGIFFEEINRAGDGGIYAEMLQNRSFEDAPVLLGWSVVRGAGKAGLDRSQPLNANNPTSLRLEGPVSVANRGFKGAPYRRDEDPAKWLPEFEQGAKAMPYGVAVEQGKDYQLTFSARGQGPLRFSLEKTDGAVLAAHEVAGIGPAWKKFEAILAPSATEPDARLVITSPATAWVDMVSLMPKGQIFRADLLKRLAEMKPAFVRFPGGCWVEGDEMRDAYRWKRTIGDIAERPGLWNRWGYHSSDGLGFHEYLLLCEALGAEPLFVVNCGMAHRDVVPLEQMDEFIQDALDAVEYCNGSPELKWGALRARAGHPAPFKLKYLEIGNENGGPAYVERYAMFHDALRRRYPDLRLIVNYRPTGTRPAEIVDEHYYNSPGFFLGNAARYDSYDRSAHKVYVGEYAVTQGSGQGNLRGAIAEAAFMTGLERNSDVVVMSSYAPLFEHAGWKRWNPNAIVFDAARSYGTPSWQVQALFGSNRPEVVLPTTASAPRMEPPASRGGMVGVGTWQTQAEFKEVKVTRGGAVLFQGETGWRFKQGEWKWEGGVLRQTADGADLRAYAGSKDWKEYTLTLKARKLGGAEGFLILFAAPDAKRKSWWNLGGWGNREHGLEVDGITAENVPGSIETGRWYDIKIELNGPAIRCWLDGKLIHDVASKPLDALYAVAGRDAGEIVLKVVNASAQPLDTEMAIKGADRLAPVATGFVLTSASGDDENTFEEPARVAPKPVTVQNAGAGFRHVFPPLSLTVLRVKTD